MRHNKILSSETANTIHTVSVPTCLIFFEILIADRLSRGPDESEDSPLF